MLTTAQRDALRLIWQRLHDSDVIWAITGSVGFALHGMEVNPHDIDVQTDRNGAYRIQELFGSERTREVRFSETQRIRSYFGELHVANTKVEIMGDLQKRLPSGEWEPPVDVAIHRRFIQLDEMSIPVLSLEYEEGAYRLLGRVDRADAIRRWIMDHPGET